MLLTVCSVRDVKIEAYGTPFFVVHVGAAVRSFETEINRDDPQNQMFSNPADFSLYQLGTYEDSTGKFNLFDVPALVVEGIGVKK